MKSVLYALVGMTFALNSIPEKTVIERNYCTEIGVFNLTFDDNEVAGSYSLTPKGTLGAVWGKLDGRKMTGRWIDPDGEGDIIISFNEDWSFFTTDYRGDDEPEKWYRDSWHGALKPQGKESFESNSINFNCN